MANKKNSSNFTDSIIEMIRDNGRLFTIFSIAIIVVSGIAIVENRDNWWILVIGVISVFAIFFLYMNARVFIKITVVALINLFLSTTAFQVGSFADQTGTGGLVWMSSTFFTFFTSLAISYGLTSAKSRWGTLGVSTILGFIVTYVLGVGGLNVSLSALIGSLLSIVSFVIFYKMGNKNKYLISEMPTNLLTEELEEKVLKVFTDNGWNATSLKDPEEDSGTILIWEDRGYVLYPVFLDEAFSSIETKRTTMLGYKENNVNPWLLNLVFTKLPIWKSRNANLNLILLDMNNNNGKIARVIGVNVPDTKRKIPVAIIPAKSLLLDKTDQQDQDVVDEKLTNNDSQSTNKRLSNRQKHKQQKSLKINLRDPEDIITMIDSEMNPHTNSLNKKQKLAISRIGKIEEDLDKDSTRLKKKNKKVKKNNKNKSDSEANIIVTENTK